MDDVVFFPNGMTVADLKALVATWPDEDGNGEPYEVWVEDRRGLTNEVHSVWPLNPKGPGADMLLSPDRE